MNELKTKTRLCVFAKRNEFTFGVRGEGKERKVHHPISLKRNKRARQTSQE